MRVPFLIAALLVGAGSSGCAPAGEAPPTLPPPLEERVPAPPPSTVTLIWQPGHYDWDQRSYRWVPGEWVERGGRRLWQDGLWVRSGAGWLWQPGHWM